MNKELLENQWSQVKEVISEKWSNLSGEDINQINGRYDQLISYLQKRYGYSKDQAEDEVRRFTLDKPFRETSRSTGSFRKNEESRSDAYSWLSYLLLIGIPLFLLLGYLLTVNKEAQTTTNNMTNQRVITTQQTTPIEQSRLDFITSQNILNALMAQNFSAADLANVKATTSNGVVTLTGFVSTAEQRATIERIAQGTPGVTRVVNQITVK